MKHRQTNNGTLRKREVTQPQQHTEYYLFNNSQGNLKAYSDDVMSFAYYGYNAANTSIMDPKNWTAVVNKKNVLLDKPSCVSAI